MNILFNDVLPIPLASMIHSNASLWNSKVILEKGQKVIIEAQSGRGKSTLIHLLFGVRKDYSGDILINDKKLSDFSSKEWVDYRKNQISIVFQDLQLFPNLSVLDNLLVKNNLTNHFSEEVLISLVNRVGLAEKLHTRCGQLSMGQQQRIAIIRALCQPFAFLLLDEPFSHLDEKNAQICMEMINEHCQNQNAGWILTSLGSFGSFECDKLIQI
jgi:ABC-type lipoprotein export system ATPase subunit